MHTTALEKQQPLVSVPTLPKLNETQALLKRSLDAHGANGERWYQLLPDRHAAPGADCVMNMLSRIGEWSPNFWRARECLCLAAGGRHETDSRAVYRLNDNPQTVFADIQNLYAKAIVLAGHHP